MYSVVLFSGGMMTQLQQAREFMESAQTLNNLTTNALIGLALFAFMFFIGFLIVVARQLGARGKADEQQQSDVIHLATSIEKRTEMAQTQFFANMEKQIEASNRVALALETSNMWAGALKTGVNSQTSAVQQVTEQTRLMKLALDQMASNLKTLSDGLDSLPDAVAEATATTLAQPLAQLQEQVTAAVNVVNAEKKLQSDEHPAMQVEAQVTTMPASTEPPKPPDSMYAELTSPATEGSPAGEVKP